MLSEDSIRTCQPDRNWTEAEPFCQSQFPYYTCVLRISVDVIFYHRSVPSIRSVHIGS